MEQLDRYPEAMDELRAYFRIQRQEQQEESRKRRVKEASQKARRRRK